MRDFARRAIALLAFLPLSFAGDVWAASPANRILTSPGQPDTPLAHSVSGRARAAQDLGPAPADTSLPAVTLHFSRSAAQQAALEKLIAAQQDPQSPLFHQWLTPAQFRQQFGLADSDLAKVSAWLTARGLTVRGTSFTNTFITASGTVAQVQRALGVSIHDVRFDGELHIANLTDPVLPSAIASVTRGISGLSDFRLKSRAILKPAFTSSVSGSHFLTPGDINTIYDLKPLLASAVNGTGVTIAVMGQTAISLSDVAAFRSAAGLSPNAPTLLYSPANLGVSSNDLDEAQLDVEWAGAIAPNASIQFVAVSSDNNQGGVITALQNSIANTATPAKILAISYGGCETQNDASFIYVNDQYYQQAVAQGQTIIGPAGDSGATDCDAVSVTAADGLSADFPGSSPNVTSVGGTMFNEGTGNYWSNATNATTDAVSSALSYIPEQVWNETSTFGSLAAGGGGASVFFAKPSWQVGTGVPADFARDVPDLALDAAVGHDGYLICASGSCVNGFRNADSTVFAIGGTSVGVPVFAGMLALVEQKINATGGLGNINPKLYGLAATSASTVFHDIVSGNNQSPCILGSPNCNSSPIGYSATAGYDLASGWGSVDGTNMANLWEAATPTGAAGTTGSTLSLTTVSLSSGVASCGITAGTLTLTVSVAAYQATTPPTTPTGTIQLFIDGAAVGSSLPLTSGAITIPLNTAALSSGAHSVSVAYSGDSTYASSRGNLSPSLSPLPNIIYVPSFIDVASASTPNFAISPCQPVLTVAAGGTASTPLTITGLNGFSGAVALTASVDGTFQGSYSFSNPSVTVSGNSAVTSTFNLSAFYQTTTTAALRKGPHNDLHPTSRRGLYETGAGGVALATLFFLVLPRRRQGIGLLLFAVTVGVIGIAGCSGGVSSLANGTPPTNTNLDTSPGYYILNITATGTDGAGHSLVHTSYLTLTVTK